MIYIYVTLVAMILFSMVDKPRIQTVDFKELSTSSKIKTNIVFFIVYMMFTVLAGIRYNVGTDYITYTMHQIPDALNNYVYSAGYKVEPLYRLLIYAGNMLGAYQWVFVFTHLIFMFFILKYIKEQSEWYAASIFIFVFGTFFSFSLNGMRQSIATAIFLYAVKFIYQKNYKKYFWYIFIAILFHKSAIIYFPLYLVNKINLTKKKNILPITVISVLLAFNSKYAYTLVYKICLKYNFYTKFFNSKYSMGTQVNTMYLSMLLLNLLLVCLFYLVQVHESNKLQDIVNLNIQLISLLFSSIAFSIPGAFRAFYFFIPIQIVFVPNILTNIKNHSMRRIIQLFLIMIYIFIFVKLIVMSNQNGTFPYQTIFEKPSI